MNRVKNLMLLFLCLLIGLISGCAGSLKKGIYLAPDFQTTSVSEINLLPAIDARVDKEVKVNLEKQLCAAVKSLLEKKGYKVSISNNIDAIAQITEDDLKSGEPELIRQLGAPGASWVMVILLIDVNTKLTFGSTGTAEVAGFLYDVESEKMIWRDKGIGKAGQGGLVGMLMKGMMDEQAISMANYNLVASIPKCSE